MTSLDWRLDITVGRRVTEAAETDALRADQDIEQQAVMALHCVRQGFVKARTAQANQIRGLLREYGLVVPQGIAHVAKRVPGLIEDVSIELPGTVFQGPISRRSRRPEP